ncbi:hypothetical protein MASR2M15_07380 [Anaerolineales bacterium]
MYDKPDAQQLIEAVNQHLEGELLTLAKATNPKLYFQTLVAIHVLKIVAREIESVDADLEAEWQDLDRLMNMGKMPHTNQKILSALTIQKDQLCQQIRSGERDQDAGLFAYLEASCLRQLKVANPRLLETMKNEPPVL